MGASLKAEAISEFHKDLQRRKHIESIRQRQEQHKSDCEALRQELAAYMKKYGMANVLATLRYMTDCEVSMEALSECERIVEMMEKVDE